MEYSPSQIRNRSFSRGLRGLSEEEVQSFLDTLAKQWQKMDNEREQLRDRVEHLEAKLNKIGDAAGKMKSAKAQVDELQKKAQEKQKRLDQKEAALAEEREEVEAKHEAMKAAAARLLKAVRSEADALQQIAAGASASAAPSVEPSNGRAKKKKEKSTQEWIDSLFPNRLGAGDDAGGDAAPASDTPSSPGTAPKTAASNGASAASASTSNRTPDAASPDAATEAAREDEETLPGPSHFEAIKKDVQRMEGDSQSSASGKASNGEDEDGPSTRELERIWDIFDRQEAK